MTDIKRDFHYMLSLHENRYNTLIVDLLTTVQLILKYKVKIKKCFYSCSNKEVFIVFEINAFIQSTDNY